MVRKRNKNKKSSENSSEEIVFEKKLKESVQEGNVNERIMKEAHNIYIDEEEGLLKIATSLGLKDIFAPSKKITVMICGNHSSGKSSFINWYTSDSIQKTSVAIETQGFTLVTSGKQRETLQGKATVHLYPHLKDLLKIKNVEEHLETEISTSTAKKFKLINFLDSPGLVDGNIHYPFEVDKAIEWFAQYTDLILVFFDPIGQALCYRTMNVVEKLNYKYADRMRYFLSKADEVASAEDRQKILIQITQNLSSRIKNQNFDLPTIYLPKEEGNNPEIPNSLEEICRDLEKTIQLKVQKSLNQLEADCNLFDETIDTMLNEDTDSVKKNKSARNKGFCIMLVALFFPFFITAYLINYFKQYLPIIEKENEIIASFVDFFVSIGNILDFLPEGNTVKIITFCLLLFFVFGGISRFIWRKEQTLSKPRKQELSEFKEFIEEKVRPKKSQLYDLYFSQSVNSESDL